MKTKANFLLKIFPTFLAFLAITTSANATWILLDPVANNTPYPTTITTDGGTFGGGFDSITGHLLPATELWVGPGDDFSESVSDTPPNENFIGNYINSESTGVLGVLFDQAAIGLELTFGIINGYFGEESKLFISYYTNDSTLSIAEDEISIFRPEDNLDATYQTLTLNKNFAFNKITLYTDDLHGLEYQVSYNTSTPVPEPAAVWLVGTGIGLLGFFARKNKK